MSYTINVDIEVHEVDHPITMSEALDAARRHFHSEIKPIQDINLSRYNTDTKSTDNFPVSVEVKMIKITEGVDHFAPDVPEGR